MLHVDGRIFRSVWKLLSAPGFLTREQFEGRRVSMGFSRLIRLYFIFSLAYFAAVSFAGSSVEVVQTDNDPEATAILQRLGFNSPAALEVAVEDARDHWVTTRDVPAGSRLRVVRRCRAGDAARRQSAVAESLGVIPVVVRFLCYVMLAFRRVVRGHVVTIPRRTMAILLAVLRGRRPRRHRNCAAGDLRSRQGGGDGLPYVGRDGLRRAPHRAASSRPATPDADSCRGRARAATGRARTLSRSEVLRRAETSGAMSSRNVMSGCGRYFWMSLSHAPSSPCASPYAMLDAR